MRETVADEQAGERRADDHRHRPRHPLQGVVAPAQLLGRQVVDDRRRERGPERLAQPEQAEARDHEPGCDPAAQGDAHADQKQSPHPQTPHERADAQIADAHAKQQHDRPATH